MHDAKRSVEFLERWKPGGPWVLTKISTDRKSISTQTFRSPDLKELREWLSDADDRKMNVYFHVNTTNGDLTKKAHKENIYSGDWLFVDVDPAEGQNLSEERERILSLFTDKLPRGIPDPTMIIFSGGGYQAFWKLETPIVVDGSVDKAVQEYEPYNVRLEQIFGGDHCHNIDRIMRLPGTTNVPDAKKRKKGRIEEQAKLLQLTKKSYPLSDFRPAHAVQSSKSGLGSRDGGEYGVQVEIPGNIERVQDLSELDEWNVPDRLKVVIAQGHHPEQPKEGDNSRSAWLFDCVCGLVRCGVPDEVIYAIITDPDWGISSSVIELRGGSERYAVRQIKRAKEFSEDPHLTMMNDRHAIIGNIGGKCRVIEEIEDDVLRRSRITVSSFEDIRNRYSHISVEVGKTDKGQPIMMPLGKYWLQNKMRRQFDTMRFMPQGDKPGVYNLWRGFNVEPRPGDCSIFLDHLRSNVCDGREELYEYLVRWMARAVQQPASPGEVAVVMRGGKGTGKSIVANIFGRLFGRHYLHVANPSHLVGNFNSHLRDVILLFADEAFYAGDKKHESVLKMLVTEDSIPIEAKGLDVETYPNYVHLIMASNDPHVIRASGDERRYFVVEVSSARKQDKVYFRDMIRQMENGGYEALLFHLQGIDLEDWQVRDVPSTDALQEQKLLSLGVEEEWWYNKLRDGVLLSGDTEWEHSISCERLEADFTSYADKWKYNRRGNQTSLGRFISRVCPHTRRVQKRMTLEEYGQDGRPKRVVKRPYFYEFGSLERCRRAWEEVYGETEWPEREEFDLPEPPADTPF